MYYLIIIILIILEKRFLKVCNEIDPLVGYIYICYFLSIITVYRIHDLNKEEMECIVQNKVGYVQLFIKLMYSFPYNYCEIRTTLVTIHYHEFRLSVVHPPVKAIGWTTIIVSRGK